jgi:hypothetical protein
VLDSRQPELPRVILDESSFELLPSSPVERSRSLLVLAEALETLLLTEQHSVHRSELLYDQPCLDTDLAELLFGGLLERDLRLRLARLLDRCPSWNRFSSSVAARVAVEGRQVTVGSSLSFAVELAGRGHNAACLTLDVAGLDGLHDVVADDRLRPVFFFSFTDRLPAFWRSLFELEDVAEADFFPLARQAFGSLVFSETLTFRRFTGTYTALRGPVVQVLAILNDRFPGALRRHHGIPHDIEAELRVSGFGISPESPGTRGSRLMARRVVSYRGEEYVCEWHAKLEPHRNRVHFTLPDPRLDGRMLVGIFVDHLDT